MVVEYLSSYDRSFRRLPSATQRRTIQSVDALLEYFLHGQRPHGLGLKRLRRDYWEFRVGIDIRALFELGRHRLTFILVGDHDAIHRWLRDI